jgi:hypothetical protein
MIRPQTRAIPITDIAMAEPFFAFSATVKAFSNFVSNETRVTSASRATGISYRREGPAFLRAAPLKGQAVDWGTTWPYSRALGDQGRVCAVLKTPFAKFLGCRLLKKTNVYKIFVPVLKKQHRSIAPFLFLQYIARMLWRSSRGRPSNAPAAFIQLCQPILAKHSNRRRS